MRKFSRRHRNRILKFGVFTLMLLCFAWLGVSICVAYSLTSRAKSPFVETLPDSLNVDIKVEELRLLTSDGESIGAWHLPGSPQFSTIVLVHGNGGHRMSCWHRAMLLHRRGYPVLLITCRAHGDSTGSLNDFGYGARHDVVATVRWLQKREARRPIVIWGASLGSAAAVFSMAELGSDISGLILECPYRNLDTALWNRMQIFLPPVFDAIGYHGIRLAAGVILPHFSQISPLNAVTTIPERVPVLILAGAADRRACAYEAQQLHEQIASHSQLEIWDGAGHLELQQIDSSRYQRVIMTFLEQATKN